MSAVSNDWSVLCNESLGEGEDDDNGGVRLGPCSLMVSVSAPGSVEGEFMSSAFCVGLWVTVE